MPMNTLRTALLALVVAAAFRAAAQPVYTFRVKVGIDRESVDSLGGRDRVVQLTEDMFRRVNRAFNYGAQLHAVYDFVVDWDAFYIYDGVSADHFNSPFEKNAIDGIIHEFGHARGVPDIYAMKVDADKNPVNGQAFSGVRCIMNYPYGEELWSDYAVRMIDHAADRNVDIDDLVAGVLPDRIRVEVADADASPAKGAVVRFYPVRWYTYTVTAEPQAGAATDRRGRCTVPVARIFEPEEEFGVRYCNCLVEAEYDGVKAYGWLPLYELQNARFAGQREHTLRLRLKRGCGLVRTVGIDE